MSNIYNAYGDEIELDKEQQACVDYRGKKNLDLVIQGVAGSGKSLVLLKRARDFINEYPNDKIAFFTFNNTLSTYASDILMHNNEVGNNVHISTLDSYLSSIFQKIPGHFYRNIAFDVVREKCMDQAISDYAIDPPFYNKLSDAKVKYWLDEITWMKRHNIGKDDRDVYLEMKRTGRGTSVRITEKDKIKVFQLYLMYCDILESKHVCEWEDIPLFISHNFDKIPEKMKFDHIFIDEAQDQSRAKTLCLYRLKQSDSSDLTIAMDMNQMIYSSDNPFLGFKREVKKLEKTYRCSVEIDALAESLRKNNDDFLEEEDKNPHIIPKRSTGILPKIHECSDSAEEKRYVIDLIEEWQKLDKNITIGILSTTNKQNIEYSSWLTDANIKHQLITKDDEFSVNEPGVKVATIYSTKGMEFTHVIIPQFVEGKLPHIHERKDEELLRKEIFRYRSLAYVGMTRAMTELVITYSGRKSRFIDEMDKNLCKFEEKSPDNIIITTRPSTKSANNQLLRIATHPVSTRTNNPPSPSSGDLKSFFESKGLEVIDKRYNNGCLWVVGSEAEIGSIINEAKAKFGVGGKYGAGKQTGYKPGWWTKANK